MAKSRKGGGEWGEMNNFKGKSGDMILTLLFPVLTALQAILEKRVKSSTNLLGRFIAIYFAMNIV